MHFFDIDRNKIELLDVYAQTAIHAASGKPRSAKSLHATHEAFQVARAIPRHFIEHSEIARGRKFPKRPPSVYRDKSTGLLRCFYRELLIRFQPSVKLRNQRKHLREFGLTVVRTNEFTPQLLVVRDPNDKLRGYDLIRVANRLALRDDVVVFAAPNFISEYRRHSIPPIPTTHWHLDNTGYYPGQVAGQDIRAENGWNFGMGKPDIVVAVLDDGVDLDHPALAPSIWNNPDPSKPDKHGRDYTCDPNDPGFANPRPKTFNAPYNDPAYNDIHGTACAGLVAANAPDGRAVGVATGCLILPVKIFNASSMAADEKVADAIRYAASIADVISCSWDGPATPVISDAITEASTQGRGGKGCSVFCSVGNSGDDTIQFPATIGQAIAVGSSTDDGSHAEYSNSGAQISVVAPSSGGMQSIFTADVSLDNVGFNMGDDALGGADGLYTNSFGGTSASTPIAAGVAAVLLSLRPDLQASEVKELIEKTADKMSNDLDNDGHSNYFGYGRLNLEAILNAAQTFGGHP